MDIRELRWLLTNEALGMWRYRWYALAAAWVLALIGWAATLFLPNEYQSSARVYVDTEQMLANLVGDMAVQPETIDQVDLMTRALTARPQLEAVLTKAGITTNAVTPEEYERWLGRVSNRISINKSRRESIYNISFSDSDPELATILVQTLLESFMESSLSKDRGESIQAQRFLEEQLSRYEARLEEAETRLADFKRENVGLMPGQGGGFYQRLQSSQERIRALQAQIDSARERSRTLQAQLRGESAALPEVQPSLGLPGQPIDQTIEDFERKLKDLLLRYTEKHPEVVGTRETLQDLYRAKEQQQSMSGQSGSRINGGSGGMNPVYQQLRLALSDSEVELSSLESELSDEQRNLAYLRSMVDTIPRVEAELNKLNRDYDVVQRQYQQLLGRLESAKLAEQVQSDTESVTFDVIEPPFVPVFPVGPNRPLLAIVVLLGSLGAALGLAFLLSKNCPVYFTVPSLRQAVVPPVLGLIEALPEPGSTRRALLFLFCAVALLIPYSMVSTRTDEILAVLQNLGLRAVA